MRRNVLSLIGSLWVVLIPGSQALGQRLVISEVLFDPVGVNTGNQLVEICNLSPDAVDLHESNIWLRFPPASWRFPEGALLRPGGRAVVHVNRRGRSAETVFFTGMAGMRSLRSIDSIALYQTSLFQAPERLLHYVQWGDRAQGGEDVAVLAGLWPQDVFVDSSASRPGSSLVNRFDHEDAPVIDAGNAVAAWCIDGSPSLGFENDECTPAYAGSGVVINEIGLASPGASGASFIELLNTGTVIEDLGALSVTLDGSESYSVPEGTLIGPGEIVLLFLAVDGVESDDAWYTGADVFRPLGRDDACSIHFGDDVEDPTRLLAFVQWGAGVSPVADVAIAVGSWTEGASVDNSGLHARGSLVFEGGSSGPDAWRVDNTPTPGAPNDAPVSPPTIVVNEVLLEPEGEDNATRHAVELRNRSESRAVDVAGLTLCVASSADVEAATCFSLPAGTTIRPAGLLVVRLNAVGDDTVDDIFTGDLVDLDPSGGEIALFLTPDVDDTNNLIDYLAWGPGVGPNRPRAESVRIWPPSDTIGVVLLQDGSSLAYLGEGDESVSFRIDLSPSIGESNEEVGRREPFRRGDCNDDAVVDISDSVMAFNFLFLGDEDPRCVNACDANRDNVVDISDGVFLLNFLFRGAASPPFPGPDGPCAAVGGPDEPFCNAYLSCAQ